MDTQRLKESALASIDSAFVVLENYPNFSSLNTDISLLKNNDDILSFLVDVIRHTAGYDRIIEFVTEGIYKILPPLEIATKGVILSRLKDYFACSLNPVIKDKLLLEGMFFSLNELDLIDMFRISPLDKHIGKFYYYGIDKDEITYPDQANQSRDFNAVLWFMRNRAVSRQVWFSSYNEKQKLNANRTFELISPYKRIVKEPLFSKKLNYNFNASEIYLTDNPSRMVYPRVPKSDGILTLEYYSGSGRLLDAMGNEMYSQTPSHDFIHVFIGNAAPCSYKPLEKYLQEQDNITNRLDILNKELEDKIIEQNDLLAQIDILNNEFENSNNKSKTITNDDFVEDPKGYKYKDGTSYLDAEYYAKELKEYTERLNVVNEEINNKENEILDNEEKINRLKNDLKGSLNTDKPNYQDLTANHYYRKTIFQWDIDYLMSVSLFEPRQVAARLIDSLVGLIDFDLNISLEQRFIREEVKKMVAMVVKTDDTIVNDCFFSFTNEQYDKELQKTELKRLGLYSVDGSFNSTTQIDPESILAKLNSLSSNATEEENIVILKGIIKDIADEVTEVKEGNNFKANFGLRCNFIENLLTNLATVICEAIVSPKIYLMMAINLKIVGNNDTFDLRHFILMYKQLLVDLIRLVRNMIIQFLFDKIKKEIEILAKKVGIKIAKETIEYYIRLINSCISCLSLSKRPSLDWTMDNVYADILDENNNNEPVNTKC